MGRFGLAVVVILALGAGAWLVLGDGGGGDEVGRLVERRGVVQGDGPGAAAATSTDAGLVADAERPAPVEAQTPAPSDARRLGLEVVVQRPDGSPGAHALVAVTDAAEALVASGVAGRDGRFTASDVLPRAPLDVWIAGVTFDVHRERFDVVDGPLVVTLPDGAEVAGVVRVDGAPPRREIPIALRVRDAVRREVPGPVYMALHGELSGLPSGRLRQGAPTVDGRFRIGGVPAGVRAEVQFPPLFRTVDDERSLWVDTPARDVLVDLVTRPLFVARFVDEDGAPLPRARASYAARAEASATSSDVTADDDGAISMTLPLDDGYAQVTLEVVSEGRDRRGRFAFDVPLASTTDVGDLVVPRGRVLDVLVVDTTGAPITDAIVRSLVDGVDPEEIRGQGRHQEVLAASDPTDADGRTRLGPLRADETRAEALALRHAAVVVPLPPQPTDEITIELPPCAVLDVTFEGDGALDGAMFVVAAEGALYAGDQARQHPLRRSLGAAAAWQSQFTYRTDEDGTRATEVSASFPAAPSVVVDDVAPGVPLEVSVKDASEAVLWGPLALELEPGERRELTVEIGGEVRTLEGRVVDAAGEPVGGAVVQITREGSLTAPNDRTQADGRFVFDDLRVASVELFVHGDDIVAKRMTVDLDDSPIEIVVERGVYVDVAVVDPAGRPVDGARVSAMDPETGVVRTDGGWGGTSPYRIGPLPAATLDVVAQLGGREWTVAHDTRVAYLELVIDDVAALAVTWDVELDASWPWLEFVPLEPEGEPVRRHVADDERAARRVDVAALPRGRYRVRLTDGRPERDESREVLVSEAFDVGPERARITLERL